MGLIENLEGPDGLDFLRNIFEYTLHVLEEDQVRRLGSAVDDLRAWFLAGGVARVKEALDDQMTRRRFDEDQRAQVRMLVDALVEEHRSRILGLMANGTIPTDASSFADALGLGREDLGVLIARVQAGERPFEDLMREHGRSEEEIAAVYEVVDSFLEKHGIFPPPAPQRKPRVLH